MPRTEAPARVAASRHATGLVHTLRDRRSLFSHFGKIRWRKNCVKPTSVFWAIRRSTMADTVTKITLADNVKTKYAAAGCAKYHRRQAPAYVNSAAVGVM